MFILSNVLYTNILYLKDYIFYSNIQFCYKIVHDILKHCNQMNRISLCSMHHKKHFDMHIMAIGLEIVILSIISSFSYFLTQKYTFRPKPQLITFFRISPSIFTFLALTQILGSIKFYVLLSCNIFPIHRKWF